MTTINVKDFTIYPAPASEKLGDGSGEQFRDEILIPALRRGGKVVVDLDGTRGYGSSFLEESFGGAVRCGVEITKENLELKTTEDRSLISEIWRHITNASKNNA